MWERRKMEISVGERREKTLLLCTSPPDSLHQTQMPDCTQAWTKSHRSLSPMVDTFVASSYTRSGLQKIAFIDKPCNTKTPAERNQTVSFLLKKMGGNPQKFTNLRDSSLPSALLAKERKERWWKRVMVETNKQHIRKTSEKEM